MARVIDYYSATAGGSSTMYYYKSADNTSAATRIYSGTVIHLDANYNSRITNSMYPMKRPSGWIPWYHVKDIKSVYKTVLDKCTPPTALAIDAATKTLTITGGDGGDLNDFTGFGISWRERSVNESAWGEWSAELVVTYRSVPVLTNPGTVRQFRVRTQGEAGSEHYSDYVLCQDLLNGNTAADMPVILLPLAGMTTCADAAAFTIDCPADPDGDALTLQRSLDDGEWTDVISNVPQGIALDVMALTETAHTIKYRLVDIHGAVSSEDGISIHRSPAVWNREINTGTVIANRYVSFADDITQLSRQLGVLRTFYGLSQLTLPGTVGRFGDVQGQLTAMQTALDECRAATGREACGFTQISAFPTAQQLLALRQAITQT